MPPRHRFGELALAVAFAFGWAGAAPAVAAPDVPVPAHCDATVNEQLAELVTRGYPRERDNVMVCGTVTRDTYYQPAYGRAGSHHVSAVEAPIGTGGSLLVQIVTNDTLDGIVIAHAGDHIAAFGQFYQTTERQRPYAAGIHDTHCSTHRGADNGWVWINGDRWPKGSCPAF
jgi:hypothetical protein